VGLAAAGHRRGREHRLEHPGGRGPGPRAAPGRRGYWQGTPRVETSTIAAEFGSSSARTSSMLLILVGVAVYVRWWDPADVGVRAWEFVLRDATETQCIRPSGEPGGEPRVLAPDANHALAPICGGATVPLRVPEQRRPRPSVAPSCRVTVLAPGTGPSAESGVVRQSAARLLRSFAVRTRFGVRGTEAVTIWRARTTTSARRPVGAMNLVAAAPHASDEICGGTQ
jgi:hypothetical protein